MNWRKGVLQLGLDSSLAYRGGQFCDDGEIGMSGETQGYFASEHKNFLH